MEPEKGALFVGWGPIIAGREAQAKRVLGDALQYCGGLQRTGRIDSFDVVVLEPQGGDLGGFVLLKGDKLKIAELRVDTDFVRTIVGVQLVHQKVGVVGAYCGVELQTLFGLSTGFCLRKP